MQVSAHDLAGRWKGRARQRGFSGLELKAFLGGAPAVFSERLFRDCGFIHREMKCIFFLFDLHDKALDMHALLPQSGGYLAWQSGAFREAKPKLF